MGATSVAVRVASVIDLLVEDHASVCRLLRALVDGSGDQADLVRLLDGRLREHVAADVHVVWPAYRRLGGKRFPDSAGVLDALDSLQETPPGTRRFDRAVLRLMDEVAAHADAHEREVFPALRGRPSRELLGMAAATMRLRRGERPEDAVAVVDATRSPMHGQP